MPPGGHCARSWRGVCGLLDPLSNAELSRPSTRTRAIDPCGNSRPLRASSDTLARGAVSKPSHIITRLVRGYVSFRNDASQAEDCVVQSLYRSRFAARRRSARLSPWG